MIVTDHHKEKTNEYRKTSKYHAVRREYYGAGEVAPNGHCEWLEVDFFDITLAGWYEEKVHYHERVLKTLYPHLFR